MAIVKINALQVPPQAGPELERRFAERAHSVDSADGFLGFQLLRPVAGDDRYFVVTQWRDEESFQAWRDGDARAAHAGQSGDAGQPGDAGQSGGAGQPGNPGEARPPVSQGASLLEFDVVLDVRPSPPQI